MNYTKMFHDLRKALGISANEYIVCDLIYGLSQGNGYCYMKRDDMAERLGLAPRTIKSVCKDLDSYGLIKIVGRMNIKMMPEWGILLDLCKRDKVQELHFKVQELHLESATFAPPKVQELHLESANPALSSIPTYTSINTNTHTEIEREEEEKPDPEFIKHGKQQRQVSLEMYEMMRKRQPEIYGHDSITRTEISYLKRIKGMIVEKEKTFKLKTLGKAYCNVSDQDIVDYYERFIKFLPPYVFEKARFNPRYICENFHKLVKEVRANYIEGMKPQNKSKKVELLSQDDINKTKVKK